MSDEREPVGEGAPRESIAGVLGVGLGLLVIAVCALMLLRMGPQPLDARAELERDFELGELPFGLAPGGAYRFSSGETVVELTDGRVLGIDVETELESPDAELAPETMLETGTAPPETPKPDWGALPEGEAGTPPARVFLVRYTADGAERTLARQFRNLEWRELADIEALGGRAVVEGGRLRWGEYAPDFVRERRFKADPPRFQDSLRVNLALPGRYWIAYAYWPEGLPGSSAPLEAVLAALGAKPVVEVPGSM